MANKIFITVAACLLSAGAFAQKTDGTTKSIVNAEKEFAKALAKDGAKEAYLQFSADNGIVFRPNPVNAKTYYAGQGDNKGISWQPAYAKISRSGDWGFTTGPYEYNGGKGYGDYLTVWKAINGKWQLALDLGIEHNKPLNTFTENFVEPKGQYTPKMFPGKDASIGLEIIASTESTLNATLKTYGPAAFSGFLNPDARLLFPGYEPVIGKDNIIAFNNRMISKISLKTAAADKAAGGELAYTYGVATIDYKADLRETFNYVFIWERQSDSNWNIIAQVFVPAER